MSRDGSSGSKYTTSLSRYIPILYQPRKMELGCRSHGPVHVAGGHFSWAFATGNSPRENWGNTFIPLFSEEFCQVEVGCYIREGVEARRLSFRKLSGIISGRKKLSRKI